MDAEYVRMFEATREIQCIIPFFKEMGVDDLIKVPIKMFADNAAAIKFCLTNCVTEIEAYWCCIPCKSEISTVADKLVKFEYVPSRENCADLFTKNLGSVKLDYFKERMGVRSMKWL